MESSREKGEKAESLAIEFIKKKGYDVIKRNFHFGRYGEIDIVAKDGDIIVFVEVKYRSNDNYGDPIESITMSKQKNIRRVAEGYLYVNKIEDVQCRFDVLTINLIDGKNSITHYENAF